MIKHISVVSIAISAMALSGCAEQPRAGTTALSALPSSALTGAAAPSVDHAQDIKEFELKRSLSGVESLMAELKTKGADISPFDFRNISELEAKKQDLERKLGAFKRG